MFQSSSWISRSRDVPIVLGLTVHGREVTLRGFRVLTWTMHTPGGFLIEARVSEAFIGMHAAAESELRLFDLRARG